MVSMPQIRRRYHAASNGPDRDVLAAELNGTSTTMNDAAGGGREIGAVLLPHSIK